MPQDSECTMATTKSTTPRCNVAKQDGWVLRYRTRGESVFLVFSLHWLRQCDTNDEAQQPPFSDGDVEIMYKLVIKDQDNGADAGQVVKRGNDPHARHDEAMKVYRG